MKLGIFINLFDERSRFETFMGFGMRLRFKSVIYLFDKLTATKSKFYLPVILTSLLVMTTVWF